MAAPTHVELSPREKAGSHGRLRGSAIRPSAIWRFFARGFAYLEYCAVYGAGSAFGLTYVTRYLRNPNPRNTVRLLRAFGATVGRGTTIKGSLFIDNGIGDENSTGDFSHLLLGENCYVGDGVFIDLAGTVVIEDNAVIAGRASFITHSECRRSPFLSTRFPRRCFGIVVGSGSWIGFGATVMAGTSVGRNAVIGAQSLLMGDADAFCVYVGSPAKKLKSIE